LFHDFFPGAHIMAIRPFLKHFNCAEVCLNSRAGLNINHGAFCPPLLNSTAANFMHRNRYRISKASVRTTTSAPLPQYQALVSYLSAYSTAFLKPQQFLHHFAVTRALSRSKIVE